jgi:hypothetical protein
MDLAQVGRKKAILRKSEKFLKYTIKALSAFDHLLMFYRQ